MVKGMNKIVAAVAIDGNFIEKSDYFNDYPFPRLLDFKENELVISNYFKMKTNDYRDHLITIPYDDIQDISLRIVKRVKGQRISLLNAYYNFDFHISTNENGEWDIETEAIYQIIDGLKRIGKLNDIVGVFDRFKSSEEFYDLSEKEIKENVETNIHRDVSKNDFQKYCDTHYDSWIQEFGFETGRLTYPDRKI